MEGRTIGADRVSEYLNWPSQGVADCGLPLGVLCVGLSSSYLLSMLQLGNAA